eukprot:CAMPEP_0182589068 /NCGR_PEP_ID=MMETSP1324-20130603/68716_1 /TAXON_ID=236786 /ORGANISM="Florenciella sp., Strain RCC1587" /LENGTH=322 /DNA_ID=CAMNT_0024806189 /DNA_START=50 /DNA_END=1014 /DNA_ORIENTATION=+
MMELAHQVHPVAAELVAAAAQGLRSAGADAGGGGGDEGDEPMYDFRVCRETWFLKVLTSASEKYRQEKGTPLPRNKARLYEMAVEAEFGTVSQEVANLRGLISRVAYLNMQHQRRQFDMGHVREALGSDLKARYDRIAAKASWVELSRGGLIPFVKVIVIPRAAGMHADDDGRDDIEVEDLIFQFKNRGVQEFLAAQVLVRELKVEPAAVKMWSLANDEVKGSILDTSFYEHMLSLLGEMQHTPKELFPTSTFSNNSLSRVGVERLATMHTTFPHLTVLDLSNNLHLNSLKDISGFKWCHTLRDLRLRNCVNLTGTLEDIVG